VKPKRDPMLSESGVPVFSRHGNTIFEGALMVASFPEYGDQLCARHLAHLKKEHAGGRVAQARCVEGHACDRDRISDVRHFAKHPTRPVVLCAKHQVELGALR
jgi:hypothetical protein